MIIVRHRNIFFGITGVLIVLSIAAFFFYGLHLGVDFTGGTSIDVHYSVARPSQAVLSESLATIGIHDASLYEIGDNGYVMESGTLSDGTQTLLPSALSVGGEFPSTIENPRNILPSLGAELRTKALVALGLVLLCILLFIAFAFRKVSEPVSSWIYGLIALVTLLHDVIIPIGFYAVLGHFTFAAIDTLFVTAILTVLGFSIHDTIVVFDRVRENLRVNHERNRKEDFAETAGRSLNQTFVRSINTSLTVLATLLVLFFIGPASTRDFALTLLVGIIAGTYSSIFLATPLLVSFEKWRRNK